MTGRRVDDQSVTLGELYRLVTSLKEEHGDKLDAIDTQVRITNGRTTKLETQMSVVQQDVRDLKPPQPPGVPVVTPEGESLSIKVSPKMWAAIVALGSGIMALGLWIQSLIHK